MTTLTIQTNENDDIFIGPDGNLSMSSGIDATAQQITEAVSTILNELRYEPERGIDYFNTVFVGSPNVLDFIRQAREEILLVPNIDGVTSFDVSQDLDVLNYTSIVQTNFWRIRGFRWHISLIIRQA